MKNTAAGASAGEDIAFSIEYPGVYGMAQLGRRQALWKVRVVRHKRDAETINGQATVPASARASVYALEKQATRGMQRTREAKNAYVCRTSAHRHPAFVTMSASNRYHARRSFNARFRRASQRYLPQAYAAGRLWALRSARTRSLQ